MDWIVTILAVWSMWLCGNKDKNGWLLKAMSQVIWLFLVVDKRLWGLVPLAVLSMVLAFRNYNKWGAEDPN